MMLFSISMAWAVCLLISFPLLLGSLALPVSQDDGLVVTGLRQVTIQATGTGGTLPECTGYHERNDEPFHAGPDGSDIEALHPNDETLDEGFAHAEGFQGERRDANCHDHGGDQDCAGDINDDATECSKTDRDYNVPLRIGLIFVILTTSFLGVVGPIFLKPVLSEQYQVIFVVLKQFGTGVIIATAFVHLLTHAQQMFANECLGELSYEATASAIVMAGLFLAFSIEYVIKQLAKKFQTRSQYNDEVVGVAVLEAGILFHSLLVGLTLVVAEDSFFITLFVVIVFHQMFEGLALGTRIASIGDHSRAEGVIAAAAPDGQDKASSISAREPMVTENERSIEETSNQELLSMRKKLLMAIAFGLITPLGMAIGSGVLSKFNGNDPNTLIAIGTLDALSAGILIWVGVEEMWASDWMHGDELDEAKPWVTCLAGVGLVLGMALMSFLGKWT